MIAIAEIQTHLVKVTRRGDWVFVRVIAEDGKVGVGEISHGRGDAEVLRWIEALRPKLIGWPIDQIEAFTRDFFHEYEGQAYHTAISGIEQALWDLLGQVLEVPIHQLLGGACRRQLRVYANINRATWDRSPKGFAENARRAVEEGFTAIKCAPFDDVSAWELARGSLTPAIRRGIDRIRAIREMIGPEVDLMVDCHSRFNAGLIVQVARHLDLHLIWLEDPVPLHDLDALRRVNEQTSMPLATGELLRTLRDFRALLERRAVEYILPDVKYVGGILPLKKIAALAEAFDVLVTPHCPSGPVSFAASVQCMATVPNFGILEIAWGEVPWRADLVVPREEIQDGFVSVPTNPGLGISLREHFRSDEC